MPEQSNESSISVVKNKRKVVLWVVIIALVFGLAAIDILIMKSKKDRSQRRLLATAQSDKAALLANAQEFAKAEAQYRQAVSTDPSYAVAHFGLGLALMNQNKMVEAEASFRQATKQDPNYAVAHNALAVVLLNQKKDAEGEAELNEALRIDPNLQKAHLNLALRLSERKQYPESEAEFRKAFSLNPNLVGANAEFHYSFGEVLAAQQKHEGAE